MAFANKKLTNQGKLNIKTYKGAGHYWVMPINPSYFES
jgi:hypothetical protein